MLKDELHLCYLMVPLVDLPMMKWDVFGNRIWPHMNSVQVFDIYTTSELVEKRSCSRGCNRAIHTS